MARNPRIAGALGVLAAALSASPAVPAALAASPTPTPPSATIASPVSGAVYAMSQVVQASYSCAEGPGGPGPVSCTGPVPSGAAIDTSTRGPHTFAVTAQSPDGLRATAQVGYTVAGPPSVTISIPANGARYTRGQTLVPTFKCAEDPFGPGLAACSAPPTVYTSRTGTFGFTVTAISTDGQRTFRTVHFTVVLPLNRFGVSHLRAHRGNGRVTFDLRAPGPGTVTVLETIPGKAFLRPRRGRVTFARLHRIVRRRTTLRITVVPNGRGVFLVHHHRFALRARLVVKFTPTGGKPATRRFSGLRVSR